MHMMFAIFLYLTSDFNDLLRAIFVVVENKKGIILVHLLLSKFNPNPNPNHYIELIDTSGLSIRLKRK